jgi:hypothetical protein
MYIFIKVFFKTICSYDFYISKLNNLKVIHDFIFLMFGVDPNILGEIMQLPLNLRGDEWVFLLTAKKN